MHVHYLLRGWLCLVTVLSPCAGQLTINQVSSKAAAFVYELPDSAGRDEAVRSIQAVHDRFRPNAPLLDAGAVPEAELRTKLSQGFLLYTTLGQDSRLWRLAAERLGWQVSAGTFRWGGFAAPMDGLRVIAVGKNPFGEGHCVIYAAASNQALVNINSVFHGPSSYVIYKGPEQLKEGHYNETFRELSSLSKAEALEDLAQFFATLERVHPNLLAKMTRSNYERLQQETHTAGTVTGADGQVAVERLAAALFRAAAAFGDGHTSVNWQQRLNTTNTKGSRFPPIRLRYDNGQWKIRAAVAGRLAGTELLAVNGKPVAEFLAPILDRCSGETQAFRAARFLSNEEFWYWLTGVFAAPEIRLRVKLADGVEEQTSAPSLEFIDYNRFLSQQTATEFRPNRAGTKVDFLEGDKVAYFQYQAFRLSDAEKTKVDDIFSELRRRGATQLVLDLRGNGGGNSAMGNHILSYLYGSKFRDFSRVEVKISDDVRPHLSGWLSNRVVENGRVSSQEVSESTHPKPAAFFTGQTYLLIDNGTFSSATDFAAMFRDYNVGTILGYETGGVPTSFGDMHMFTLRHSAIPCGVSFKRFYAPKPKPGDDVRGVQPDVPWNDALLKDFANERDPGLAFTLRYLRDHRTRR